MWLYYYFRDAWENNRTLALVFLISAGVLLGGALLAYIFRAEAVYLSISAIVGGGAYIAATALNVPETERGIALAALFMMGGGFYLVLFAFLSARRIVERRRKQRRQMRKELQFTLPDRDNTYVRARLNTTLNTPLNADTGGENAPKEETTIAEGTPMNLGYVRKLLVKLKEAPLTKAERLETEDVARVFAVYAEKENWTASDTRTVNELCAWLLKLCAKYSVGE